MQHMSDDMKLVFRLYRFSVTSASVWSYIFGLYLPEATYQNSWNIEMVSFAGREEQICRYRNRKELPEDAELNRKLAKELAACEAQLYKEVFPDECRWLKTSTLNEKKIKEKEKRKKSEESALCFWHLFVSCGLQMEPRIVFANPSLRWQRCKSWATACMLC